MLQDYAYSHQQTSVQTLTLENVINVRTLTGNFFCQPCCRLALLLQNLMNVLANIHTFSLKFSFYYVVSAAKV